jgi:hypothetical protein
MGNHWLDFWWKIFAWGPSSPRLIATPSARADE